MTFEDFKEVIGTSASICQIIQFLSGVFVCKVFMKKGTSDDTSPFPFICGFLSCAVWTGYSKLLGDFTLIYINVLGSLMMFGYISIYYIYTSRKSRIFKMIIGVVIALIVTQVHITSIENIDEKKEHLGILCSILTLSFFAAPFANLAQVMRLKSADSLPFPIIITSFIVSFLWTLYGYLLKDGFVMYLNFIGFSLSFLQLSLFCVYPSRSMKTHRNDITVLIPEHRIKISS